METLKLQRLAVYLGKQRKKKGILFSEVKTKPACFKAVEVLSLDRQVVYSELRSNKMSRKKTMIMKMKTMRILEKAETLQQLTKMPLDLKE